MIWGVDLLALDELGLARWPDYSFWNVPQDPLASIEFPAAIAGYQTYVEPGMFPGPICTPTVASIDAALPNLGSGIVITGTAHGNAIGGFNPSVETKVHMSGNGRYGNEIRGYAYDNHIFNTIVGAGFRATELLPNGLGGIFIGQGTSGTVIGGAEPLMANRVLFNNGPGITLGKATATVVVGNEIRENTGDGLWINAGRDNVVGIPGTGNRITSNGSNGIRVAGDTQGSVIVANQITASGGQGYVLEYAGPAIDALSMESRMTICNMSIEAGARAGYCAPDDTTFAYLEGKAGAPKDFDAAVAGWRELRSDADAEYDRIETVDVAALAPQVSWGTNPGQVAPITGSVPTPTNADEERALAYMGLTAGQALQDVKIDRVFLGSCTNSRIEDMRAAARIVEGRKVAANVSAMVVPGSMLVKAQAEREGLDRIFIDAGFDWRPNAGCSMCLGMNPDILKPGERCASTSNRNFEGRQGTGGRTHLMSPEMAAAAAVTGHLTDIREWE